MRDLFKYLSKLFLLFLIILINSYEVSAQNLSYVDDYTVPNLYLDCSNCFENYIQSEISFINFVRDPADADIHLLITTAQTGSGGEEYFLKFIGKKKFDALKDTLSYISIKSNSMHEERTGLVQSIKIGLFPFLQDTPLIKYANLDFLLPEKDSNQVKKDRWNYWLFEIDIEGEYDSEERQKSYEIEWDFDVDRVTTEWKIDLEFDYDIEREKFEFEEKEDIKSLSRRKSFEGLIVKSLSRHWSAGVSSGIASSTFDNLDLKIWGSPTIEFNIFPYEQYNRRELRIQYRLSPTFQNYRDTTIFNVTKDRLIEQEIEAILEITETWGSVEASLEGSHFLQDISKNRLELETSLEFRIYRGLAIELGIEYSLISDQISLPKKDLTDEEIFLRQKALATDYSLNGMLGISYTFGSVYSNIVNPRMD